MKLSISETCNPSQAADRQRCIAKNQFTTARGPFWRQDFEVDGSGYQATMNFPYQYQSQDYFKLTDPSNYQGANQRDRLTGKEPVFGQVNRHTKNPFANESNNHSVRAMQKQTQVIAGISSARQMFRTPTNYPYQNGKPWYTQI
jgi:hypothetical protein